MYADKEVAGAKKIAAQATAKTATLSVDLEKERSNIARAQAETAQANERTAELRLALEKEIAARQPRSLSQEQHRTLVQMLTPAPKGRVIVKPNFVDMEATQFANQIKRALTEAGFEGVGDAPLDIVSIGESGVVIAINDPHSAPPHAMPIIAAFQRANISMMAANAKWVPDNTVVIAVGRKP